MPYGYVSPSLPICEFARVHPFLPHNIDPKYLKHVGEIVYIDLSEGEEIIRRGYDKGCKSAIKKAERSGVIIKQSGTTASNLLRFADLYIKTMERNQAAEDYLFPPEFFFKAKCLLDDHLSLYLAHYEDKVIAGALFLHYGKFVHYFLAGSDADYRHLCANNLLLDTVIMWACCKNRKGFQIFNLGGGLGGSSDSLMSFKRSFSHKTKPFYIYCKINNQQAYNELCSEKGIDPGSLDFFPAYRR